MAYSDYGGYAYRNGERVKERSDFVITTDGGFGTPGMYPGFVTGEVIKDPHHHVVLGDGPIMVGLHKQSYVCVYRVSSEQVKRIDFRKLCENPILDEYDHIDHEEYIQRNKPLLGEIDGHKIEIKWTDEDNYYQYVKLTQPDGTLWHGFSGYGVGAGLEGSEHGFSTEDREEKLVKLWPEAIKTQEKNNV